MERTVKAFSCAQRKELEALVAPSIQILRAILFVGLTVIVGMLFRALQNSFLSSPPIWIAPTLGLAIWLYFRSGRWTGGPAMRERMREDLAGGSALLTVIEPQSVLEVTEIEDEGPTFIIETATDETVLLSGQEMEQYKRQKFPWARFGVAEAPRSKRFFGLECMGEPIPVDSTIPALSYETIKALDCIDENFVVLNERQKRILGKGLPPV